MRRRSYEDAVAGEERLREREGELIKLLLTMMIMDFGYRMDWLKLWGDME